MSKKSGQFFIGSIVTILALYGLVLIILNDSLELGKGVTAPASMDEKAVEERIKPVAEVNIGEPPAVQAPAAEEETDAAGGAGKQIVAQVCSACHGAGLMGAPKIGNVADWAPRIEKGMDTLHKHAIEGFNMMPAKGGRADLSDDAVMAAVDYMVSQSK
ncbi:c-type cytochrome [Methylophaga sulfidovorans]|uniref:Cytochrome c5 n=1 Tax=Methylophaga sulfidovorans TaxID=45496 RepID=A0A1I4AI04_9GAMM|nr:cytochrome c5 family protein [Methylophaga sulfidovorans]SFK55647.1 Cytochrome c5 [Methylophaga sulfidovorans]